MIAAFGFVVVVIVLDEKRRVLRQRVNHTARKLAMRTDAICVYAIR